jgi:hypothetical protein
MKYAANTVYTPYLIKVLRIHPRKNKVGKTAAKRNYGNCFALQAFI